MSSFWGLKRNFLAIGAKAGLLAGAALVVSASPALAQSAPAGDGAEDTITVTGIRYSLKSAADLKRTNEGLIEAVVAEDIGKLPDLSVAESLARLPGIAAQRVDGRAQELSIRGMGPEFAVTLFNGNEVVSSGDGRSFQYDQLPAELVNSMVVYKTSDVTLASQGLAGTVDIRTVHPLSINGRQLAFNVRGEANGYGKLVPGISSHGERISGTYIDQFADGRLGIALGFAHLGSPIEKKYFNPWDFGRADDLGVTGPGGASMPGNPLVVDGFETGTQSTKAARDSFLGVLEYKSGAFHSTVNYLHSEFNQHMRGVEVIGIPASWSPGTTPEVVLTTSSPITERVTNATMAITYRGNDRKDRIDMVDWNNELALGDWMLRGDLSWSHARRNEAVAESYASNRNPFNFTVTFPADFKNFGQISGLSGNFADPSAFWLSTFWWGPPAAFKGVASVKDETKSARVSLHRDWSGGALSSLDLGAIYSKRQKDLTYVGTSYDFVGSTACSMGDCLAVPSGLLGGNSALGFNGIGNVFYIDTMNAIANSAYYRAAAPGALSPSWNWGVKEKIFTGYGKLGFDVSALIPWKGSLGVQVVSVDQSATGLYDDQNGGITPSAGGAKYTDVLPSLVLAGDLGGDTKLRIGVARAVSRPNMEDLRAGLTASVSAVDRLWSGGGGNPALKPWLSTDYDLSLEHYFGPGSYVALAFFDKEISRAIITQTVAYDFSGFTNPTSVVPISNMGSKVTPTNVSGGYVRGLEFTLAFDGKTIASALDGFGFSGSAAYSDSNLPGTNADGTANGSSGLEGLSNYVANATVYYEKNGIQLRVGERYRSGFTATRHNAFRFVMDTIRPELVTDLQAGYTFQGGALKGLGVLFEVNNLFDRPYVVTQTAEGQTVLKEYHQFGRQFLLGLSYKF